jgi:hypothetical protein
MTPWPDLPTRLAARVGLVTITGDVRADMVALLTAHGQAAILAAVERSLADAAFCYLDYLWRRRDTLLVVHPWLVEAHQQLAGRPAGSEA